MRQDWEQLDNEGPKPFDAFQKYIALPRSTRSIDSACKGRSRVAGRAPRRWFQWSTDYRWMERAAAWDAHCDTERLARLKAVEGERAEFEIGQLPRLVKAEAAIWKTLSATGKDSLSHLDPAYRALHKTALLLGREIANGPRKPKPSDAEMPTGDRVLIEVRFVAAKAPE